MSDLPICIGAVRKSKINIIASIVLILVVIFFTAELYFSSRYIRVYIEGDSMQTTLTGAPVSHDSDVVYAGGDYVFADRYATPQRGDIVVINAYNKKTHETKVIIKRIIALEGDYIQIIDGVVWLNDKLLEESYINPQNNTNCESYPLTYIPEGGMFVMGDNRDDSNDSRKDYGVLQTSDILGVVTQWSIDSKSFITSINTFFDFTVKGWFS